MLSLESSVPVDRGVIAYLLSSSSWTGLVKEVECTGIAVDVHIVQVLNLIYPFIVRLKKVSTRDLKDAEGRVRRRVSFVCRKVVIVPYESREAVEYLCNDGSGKEVV